MKNQLEWASVDNLDEARKIARLASLAVPELQPDFEKKPLVEISAAAAVADYRFVRITDKTDKALYGFFPTDFGCFIPLDKNRQAFEFLRFYLNDSYIDEVNRVQALLADMEVTQERGIPYGNYLPLKNGGFVGPTEAIRKHAQSYYKESGIEQAWRYELPFWNVSLFEFMFAEDGKRIARYALFREEAELVKHFGFLNGSSTDVYIFLSKENGLTKENIPAYLKFFCWALEATEGKFVLPETVRELSWERVPEKVRWKDIYNLIDIPNPFCPEQENEKNSSNIPTKPTNTCGKVAYGRALFDAGFNVDPDTGEVAMTSDKPLLENLDIKALRFSTEKSPDTPQNTSNIHPSTHQSQSEEYSKTLQSVQQQSPISSKDFLDLLKTEGFVKEKRISGKVSIGDCAFEPCRESINIINCWFDDPVWLTTHDAATAIRFEDCMFAKIFSARGCVQKKSLRFEKCWFNDILEKEQVKQPVVVDFENYRSESSLIFMDCYLLGQVCANGMRLGGDLNFYSCLLAHDFFPKDNIYVPNMENIQVNLPQRSEQEAFKYIIINGKKLIHAIDHFVDLPILSLDNSLIKGNFELSVNTQISDISELGSKTATILIGNVSAKGVNVCGHTSFLGAFIAGTLNLENGSFHQNVCFNEFLSNYIQFLLIGDLKLDNCRIAGFLNLSYANIEGNVGLDSIHVEINIDLLASKIKGNLSLGFSIIKGMLVAARSDTSIFFTNREVLWIGGDLLISSAEIKHILLAGANVEGKVEVNSGHFHSIEMILGDNINSPDFSPLPFRAKNIWVGNIVVEGTIDFSGIHITSYQTADGLAKKEELKKNTQNAACTIRASQIRGDLRFFGQYTFKRTNDLYPSETRLTWGNLNLEANTIGGRLDLKQLQIDDGDIILNGTRIQLNIDISQFYKTYSAMSTIPLPKQLTSTVCWHLRMEKVFVNGDVLLTGIKTRGSIKANGAQVKGGFCFNMDISGKSLQNFPKNEVHYSGEIKNKLELTDAEINWMNLHDINFPKPEEESKDSPDTLAAPIRRIILERTKINNLVILSKLPIINLRDVGVLHWDLCSVKQDDRSSQKRGKNTIALACFGLILILLFRFMVPDKYNPWGDGLLILLALFIISLGWIYWHTKRPKTHAPDYLQVLEQMDPFEKSPYIDIETALRNESKGEDANEVYRAMQKRSRKTYGWVLKLLDSLWYITTGYGTRLWALLFFWVGVFLFTAFYVSYPGNHQPTHSYTSVGACCLPDNTINPDSIPSLSTSETLMLAAKHCIPGMNFPANGNQVVTEDTGLWLDLIYLCSFILLSLFGVSVTARLIRGKQ